MSDSITGTCNHTGYQEFDSLTGYVTGNYSYEWTDKRGTRWRKQVTVTNLGRPDRGIPVDPDAAMTPDYWREELPRERKPHDMTGAKLEMMREVLRGRPCKLSDLVELTGLTLGTIKHLLAYHKSNFVVLTQYEDGALYGLAGQDYSPILHGSMPRIVEYLRANGPSTVAQILRDCGMIHKTFNKARSLNLDVLIECGKVSVGNRPSTLWGVRGIHEPLR